MKLWTLRLFCTASLLILSGCTQSPKPSKEAVIDKTLPVVTFTQNGTIVDMKSIAFEWETIKDPRVEGIYIYKSSLDDAKAELSYYETLQSRFKTHFVDTNVKPDSRYTYAFKTFSKNAESMNSKLLTLNTLPVLQSVSWIHSIDGMPRTAKILWRPHDNQRVKSYIVERKTLQSDAWKRHAEIEGRLNVEFVDEDLKDQFTYMYRILVRTYDDIISTPSEIVKVVTKALPKEVSNITASRDLPRRVELHWSKSDAKDFSRYYLYRSQKADGGYELIAKLHNNFFVDEIGKDGEQYFYRVSVLDQDGLESNYQDQSIQGLTLIKPKAPAMFEAKLLENTVELRWNKVDDRTQSYIVAKRFKVGLFEEIKEDFPGIVGQKFIDSNIEPNQTYFYKVYAVDLNGIKSEPSLEVELKSSIVDAVDQKSMKKNEQKRDIPQKTPKQEPRITPAKNTDIIEM